MNAPDADLLVAVDDTGASYRAAEFGIEWSAATDRSVDIVHVGSSLTEADIRTWIESLVVEYGVVASVDVVSVDGSNDPVPERLGEVVRDGDYELLAMGNENRGYLDDLTHESVSNPVIEDVSIPVVLVP